METKSYLNSLFIGATITANVNDANVDRAKGIKILKYAMKIWSEAQAKVATVSPHTRKEGMDGSTMKWFTTTVRRDYTEKGFGIGATKATTQSFGRRLLRTRSYNTAFQIDKDDLVGNEFNIHNVVSVENKKGLARLTDQIALSGLIAKPVVEETRSYGTNEQPDAASAIDTKAKKIAFARLQKAGAATLLSNGSTSGAFDCTDVFSLLAAITNLMQIRGISGELCVTLTPLLRSRLQKDTVFRNLEDTYMLQYRSGTANTGFNYLGLTFVNTHYDVMPLITANNIATFFSAATTASVTTSSALAGITVRSINEDDVDFGTKSTWKGETADTEATATSATTGKKLRAKQAGGTSTDVTVKSSDMIYVWAPEALIFAERPELRFARMSELPLHQYAEQSYDQVHIGAMCIDEDYALAIPLKGTCVTES